MSVEEYSYSFLLFPKMKTATSTEHNTDSSCAFLNRPPFLFRKVLYKARLVSEVRGGAAAWLNLH